MPDSDYPWIDIWPVTRASRADLGWTNAECTICGRSSGDNAEPLTEDWTHEHAQSCYPRWRVRKEPCPICIETGGSNFGAAGQPVWRVFTDDDFEHGCRPTYVEAINYATRKAREFLCPKLAAYGLQPKGEHR